MAILQIPVNSDVPFYSFQVDLESVTYTLTITYNARSDMWSMDIGDIGNTLILTGICLLVNANLTGRFLIPGLPPGKFLVIDTQGKNHTPGRNDLGVRNLLMYEESK